MKRNRFRKKVYRQIGRSTNLAVGDDRPVNGFGYTIIPMDVDREDYLKIVYQTGYAMILTLDREILKDVKIPNHLIDQIKFPKEIGEYGDLVSWSAVKQLNQIFLTGIYTKPGQFYPYTETSSVKSYISEKFTVTRSIDSSIPIYSVSVDSEDEESGGLEFKARGSSSTSRVRILTDGNIDVSADDSLKVSVEKKLEINISSEEGTESQLIIDKDGGLTYTDQFDNKLSIIDGSIEIESKQIKLGDKAQSPAVLGSELSGLLTKLIAAISKITVISSSPGSSSSIPANAVEIAEISSDIENILSSKTIIE